MDSMWRDKLEMLPDYMQGPMSRWIEHGIKPGSFLTAVLANDLFTAVGQADSVNSIRLRDYVVYLYNYAPSGCYGSPEKVAEWYKSGGLSV